MRIINIKTIKMDLKTIDEKLVQLENQLTTLREQAKVAAENALRVEGAIMLLIDEKQKLKMAEEPKEKPKKDGKDN